MSYEFIDTTQRAGDPLLPSEAVQINGEYLETLITGYRTLTVSGREGLSAEVEQKAISSRDGSFIANKRHGAREIIVKYQLLAKSNEAFRESFTSLNKVLDVDEAEFIFADEADKFFIGTPTEIGEVSPGRNCVTGEWTILCSDPFKYSVEEFEATPTLDDGATFVIDYDGTHPARPILEADFYSTDTEDDGNGDCGYIAFVDQDENIIQLGNVEETDGVEQPKSQTLVNNKFPSSNWSTSTITTPLVSGYLHTGSTGTKTISSTKWLYASSYGSNASGGHGPISTVTIKADEGGELGADNFRASTSLIFAKKAAKESGNFFLWISDSAKKPICGVRISSGSGTTKGNIYCYIGSEEVKKWTSVDLSYYNKKFGYAKYNSKKKKYSAVTRTISITKSGDSVTFDVAGLKFTTVKPLAKARYMSAQFTQFKTTTAVNAMGISWAKFIKDNCDALVDIPNTFTTNDVVTCDCSEAAIYLTNKGDEDTQGERIDTFGAVGNDWENFTLKPGQNQITTAYSDWVEYQYKPTFKIKYRKVFK